MHINELLPPDWEANYRIEQANTQLKPVYKMASPVAQRILRKKLAEEPLGSGKDKVVYEWGDEQKIAFTTSGLKNSEQANRVKQSYYVTKLLHLLMPENVPDMKIAGWQPPLQISERVKAQESNGRSLFSKLKIMLAEKRLKRKLDKLGVIYDDFHTNFMPDESGNQNYIDSFGLVGSYTIEKLEQAAQSLPADEKVKAHRYIEKLKQLDALIN